MDLCVAHPPLRRFVRLRGARQALAVAGLASLAAIGSAQAVCGTAEGTARVADVDERLDLVLVDGRTVRLGGLILPDPERAPDLAEAARDFIVTRIVGRDGDLERLASGTDRWGRVVADIQFSDLGPDGHRNTAGATLLAAGYGLVSPAFEARGCVSERLRIEDQARSGGLGLWGDPGAAIIDAADAETLRRNEGRFVVIEGRVRRVGFGRSRLYLDLMPRGGPTIVVPRKFEATFARAGHAVDAAAGERIRVRGALDDRLGPRLEVSEPAMIEFLGRSDAPGVDKPHL
jgi:endonuclease YncB( thermonuclease family)